jgi:tetratricopeptide (TPR) repeat protein
MKQKLVMLLIVIAFITKGYSQKKEPEFTVHLLANDKISEVNVDQDKFVPSIGKIIDYCQNKFNNISVNQKIGVLIIVHKTGRPTYQCFSNPKIASNIHDNILKELSDIQVENTKIVDFPFFISINCSKNGEITDFDDYVDPIKKQNDEYEKADLQTKYQLIKDYAINEVLPVLSEYQVIVEDQYVGVKQFGNLIKMTDFNQVQDIDSLTSTNKYYWRAIMEMNVGNQLIPITKIFALVALGEIDHAQKYIEIIDMFSDPKTIPNDYLEKIKYRIKLFNQDLHSQIEKGIAEHDKGNYQNAIKIYDDILKVYPNSSWALYEKYYSDNAEKLENNKITKNDRTDWDIAKVEIYRHNPLYNMDVRASTGREAYLLYRRQEISSMFKNKEEKLNDVFKYAEISTDLGVYDFAAQLFWLTATFDKKNMQKSINNYLYCLDKLGEKELKSNFKGDFDKIFKSIEKNKEKEMKSNSFYKSMKN